MMTEITSAANPTYKYLKSLNQKKYRTAEGVFVAEGEKSVRDAIAAGYDIHRIAVSSSFYRTKQFDYHDYETVVLADSLFAAICDMKTPQGILAVCTVSEMALDDVTHGKYVYCDHVSDPGNIGTMIRTADAAGFDGVLLSEGCADLYNPKTVRAAMGSFFHIPIITGLSEVSLTELKQRDFSLVCGVLHADSIDYREADLTGAVVIIVGNEANGVSERVVALCDTRVTIPIVGRAESLNAAIAAAILMYEALRQET